MHKSSIPLFCLVRCSEMPWDSKEKYLYIIRHRCKDTLRIIFRYFVIYL